MLPKLGIGGHLKRIRKEVNGLLTEVHEKLLSSDNRIRPQVFTLAIAGTEP